MLSEAEPVQPPVFIWLHLEPVGAGPFSPLTWGQDCLFMNTDSAFPSTRYSVCCGGFAISAFNWGALAAPSFVHITNI